MWVRQRTHGKCAVTPLLYLSFLEPQQARPKNEYLSNFTVWTTIPFDVHVSSIATRAAALENSPALVKTEFYQS